MRKLTNIRILSFRCAALAVFLFLALGRTSQAEKVYFPDGSMMDGQIVDVARDSLRVKVGSKIVDFRKEEITNFEELSRNYSTSMSGSSVDAEEIWDRVTQNYQSMRSYQAAVDVVQTMRIQDQTKVDRFQVLIKLAKPSLYRITWNAVGQGRDGEGVIWNDGKGPHVYLGRTLAFSKRERDEETIEIALNESGSLVLPGLFFPIWNGIDVLSNLSRLQVLGEERYQGTDCYVLSGLLGQQLEISLWIAKSSFHILKHSIHVDDPSLAAPLTEIAAYSQIKENVALANRDFQFFMPDDVQYQDDVFQKIERVSEDDVVPQREYQAGPPVDRSDRIREIQSSLHDLKLEKE